MLGRYVLVKIRILKTGGAFWLKSLPRSEAKLLLLGRTFFDENPDFKF